MTVALEWKKDGTVEVELDVPAVTAELGAGVELCWPYEPQLLGAAGQLGGILEPRDSTDLQRFRHGWVDVQ